MDGRTITLTDHNTGKSLDFTQGDRGGLLLYFDGEGDPLETSPEELTQVLEAYKVLNG